MKKAWLHNKKGASLIEVLLALAILALFITAIIGALIYGRESSVLVGSRKRAVLVAEEGLEAVRSIRDQNYSNLTDGTYGISLVGGNWVINGAQDVVDMFTRTITISTIDANSKTITSNIDWQANFSRSGNVSLETILSNWKGSTGTANNFKIEVGTANLDERWRNVQFSNTYTSPVVVASYYESANTVPASVRIRNLDTDKMEMRLEAPGGENLSRDIITYMVVEEGAYNINGVKIEAHKYDTNTLGYKNNWNYDTQSYTNSYTTSPLVFHQVLSTNDANWVTTYVTSNSSRTQPPTTTGIRIALNGAEAVTSHGTETIGWIAIDRDLASTIDTTDYETNRTSDSVLGHTNGCYNFGYQNTYSSVPLAIVTQQEMDGGDGGWGLTCDLNQTQVGMHSEEDTVGDSERAHTTETFGYIIFEQGFSYEAP